MGALRGGAHPASVRFAPVRAFASGEAAGRLRVPEHRGALPRLDRMELLHHVLLVLHLLGWAIVLGGVVVNIRTGQLPAGILHGALTALATGIALVLVGSLGLDRDYDHVKLGAKLLVALAVTALVLVGRRQPERVGAGLSGAIAGLTALNVTLAVLW